MSREGPHRDAAPAARTGERLRLRLRLLERAAARVGSTLDLFRTASELAGAAVPGFAEVAVVELADVVLRGEAPPPGPWDDSAAVRRAAVAGAGGGSTRAPGDVWVPRSGSPHALALADLRPRLVARLAADRPWAAEEPALERLLRDGGAASMIAAPLVVRGAALGLACFYRTGAAFDAEDLAAAAGLAAFAATSVDNARRHTREKALARLVQRTLVPGRLPTHVAASTACTYRPVAAGGSWFDVVPLSGARIACVVGEVSGHGMPAVSLMGQVSTAVATLAGMDLPPDAVLGRVHDLVVSSEAGRSTLTADGPRADGLTVGCVIACYDPVAGTCTVARAGHPAPTVVLPDGGSTVVEAAPGPALGGQGQPSYPLRHLALPAGSVLALHTAAVPDPGPFLSRSLASAGGDLHEASDGVLAEAFPDGPTDDFILFLARTQILGPDRTRAWRLPNRPESAGTARRAAARQLAGWGLTDMAPGTELLVSELVTNAVRYSDGDVELRLIVRENTLACEVTDTGRAAPTLRRAQDDEEGGRGLFLVARLTLDWGVRTAARGKTVWAEQLLPGRGGTDPED